VRQRAAVADGCLLSAARRGAACAATPLLAQAIRSSATGSDQSARLGSLGFLRSKLSARPQALVDSPEITRTIINFKRLLLTDLTVEVSKTPNKKTLAEALAAAGAHCRARLAGGD